MSFCTSVSVSASFVFFICILSIFSWLSKLWSFLLRVSRPFYIHCIVSGPLQQNEYTQKFCCVWYLLPLFITKQPIMVIVTYFSHSSGVYSVIFGKWLLKLVIIKFCTENLLVIALVDCRLSWLPCMEVSTNTCKLLTKCKWKCAKWHKPKTCRPQAFKVEVAPFEIQTFCLWFVLDFSKHHYSSVLQANWHLQTYYCGDFNGKDLLTFVYYVLFTILKG